MKYYSEILEELFDNEEALQKAEQEHESKQKEKDIMYNKVVDALYRTKEAQKEYENLLDAYIKKYGSFVHSYNSNKNDSEFPYTFFFNNNPLI